MFLSKFENMINEFFSTLRQRLRNFTATTGRGSLRRSIGRLRRRSKRRSANREIDPRLAQLEEAEKKAGGAPVDDDSEASEASESSL